MPQLFGIHGTTRGKFNETSSRGLSPRDRELADLFENALLSQIEKPQAMNIPTPLSQGISGLEDVLPGLFANAFGAKSGLANVLGGGGPTPTFGRTQTRAELGLQDPTLDPAGFLPPAATVGANLPPVRVPPAVVKDRRLQNRGASQKRLQRSRENPKNLEPYKGSPRPF